MNETESGDFFSWLSDILQYPLFKLGKTELTLTSLAQFFFFVVLVFLAENLLRRAIVQRLLRRTHLNPSLQYSLARIGGYIFIFVGLYVALNLVGIDLSSLAILAGAVGVGLGFGLQNIVSNFVSGVMLLAERPISIGDRVEVNGVHGQVKRISLRSTLVVTNDNISVIVPNSNFISEPVVNWSYGDPKVRLRLPVGVAYGTDPERVRSLLLQVALAHPAVLRDPAPNVFFKGFGESSLDFELAVWTAEMTKSPLRFRSDLFFAMEKTLREHGVEIPFPQRDIRLRTDPSAETPSPLDRARK